MEPTTITVHTASLPRFGELTYADTDVFELPYGIPGFQDLHRWLFLTLDSQPGYVWLQSLDDLDVALPAANPWTIFENYEPSIPAYAFGALGIAGAEDFTLLCVATVGKDAREMTINLASPILVNLRLRKAMQLVLDGNVYALRHPIPRKLAPEPALTAKAS